MPENRTIVVRTVDIDNVNVSLNTVHEYETLW